MKSASVVIGIIVFIAGLAVFAQAAEKKSAAAAVADCSRR